MKFPDKLLRRSVQLLFGLLAYGFGIAFMVNAHLGAAPWDVLNLGIIHHVPLSFGLVNMGVSAVILLMWIPLRERPGVGSVLNAFLVGPAADLGFVLLPEVQSATSRVAYFAVGLVLIALATGLYLGSQFGSGPRDGIMTGLHRITGVPLWIVRTGIEVTVVFAGWLLGASVGIGTLMFAVMIGPLAQYFLKLFAVNVSDSD